MAKIDLGLIRGSMWYQGTKITGQNTEGVIFPETGIGEALKGDKYQNSETNDLYECIKGGAADIAQWKWYGNISFGDISDRAVTYELPDTVDMLQIPASGGLLKNFVGWILKSITTVNQLTKTFAFWGKTITQDSVSIETLREGLYNLNSADYKKLVGTPNDITEGRTLVLTSGIPLSDERVFLILNSHASKMYFGSQYGGEIKWKQVI